MIVAKVEDPFVGLEIPRDHTERPDHSNNVRPSHVRCRIVSLDLLFIHVFYKPHTWEENWLVNIKLVEKIPREKIIYINLLYYINKQSNN